MHTHTHTYIYTHTLLYNLKFVTLRSVYYGPLYIFFFSFYIFFPYAAHFSHTSLSYPLICSFSKKKKRKSIHLHIRTYIDTLTLPKRTIDTRKISSFQNLIEEIMNNFVAFSSDTLNCLMCNVGLHHMELRARQIKKDKRERKKWAFLYGRTIRFCVTADSGMTQKVVWSCAKRPINILIFQYFLLRELALYIAFRISTHRSFFSIYTDSHIYNLIHARYKL